MFIDADAHHAPDVNIFSSLDNPEFISYYKNIHRSSPQENYWQKVYKQIADPSWPECNTIADFAKLPLHIRQEISTFNLDYVKVYSDFSEVHVDPYAIFFPSIEVHSRAIKELVKVDRQLLNPQLRTAGMGYSVEPAIAVELTKLYNRGMVNLCKNYPQYDITGWLALQDIDASMQELEYIIDNDFFGVVLGFKPPWSFMPQFYPLFKRCEETKLPIYFHQVGLEILPLWALDTNNPRYQILQDYPGWLPTFTGADNMWLMTVIGFITEGILDLYPDLRIVLSEVGTNWVSEVRTFMLEQGWADPLPYFKKNFWFTTEVEDPAFLDDAQLLGWDRLLFATDYPHNDPGGNNRYHDVDMTNDLLAQGKITQKEYDLFTHKNYQLLKSRS